LRNFERECNQRTRVKVLDSRKGVQLLHDVDEGEAYSFSCGGGVGGDGKLKASLCEENIIAETDDLDYRCRAVAEKLGLLIELVSDSNKNNSDNNSSNDESIMEQFEIAVEKNDMKTVRHLSNVNPFACRASSALRKVNHVYTMKWLVCEFRMNYEQDLAELVDELNRRGVDKSIIDFLQNRKNVERKNKNEH